MKVYAYTAPFTPNPEYINVTPQDNGSTIVSVRTMGAQNTSVINLPPDECEALGKWLLARAAAVKGD